MCMAMWYGKSWLERYGGPYARSFRRTGAASRSVERVQAPPSVTGRECKSMSAVDTSPPRPARRYWLWLVAIGAIALGVGGYTIWAGWKLPQPGVVPSPSAGDPPGTYETPFLNV